MPDPINDVRVLIQMMSGQMEFDPWKASSAVLDLAATAFSIFVPKSVGEQAALPDDFHTNAIVKQEFTMMALASLLPPEERNQVLHQAGHVYTTKFYFPTELVVRVALSWVLEKTLQYLITTLRDHEKQEDKTEVH